MKLEKVKINELKEYENNAKIHTDKQVEQIANSIREFGYNDLVAVDENNMIIEGHGRVQALKLLNYDEIEVIRLSHLNEKQKRAYILAHNQLNLSTGFDLDVLETEINNIVDFDMSDFGFEFSLDMPKIQDDEAIEEEVETKEHHRDTTINQYNLFEYNPDNVEGAYNMPVLAPCYKQPKSMQGFNYVLNKPNYSQCVHFFLDDYQFERIWQRPHHYIELLKDFDCVLTPDFSLYLDMPIAMQVWNVYRSRLIGQICQTYNIDVIPTVSWSTTDSFDFCFDGLPKHSALAISTIGIKRDEFAYAIWSNGVTEMIKRLSPKKIIIYGGKVEYDYPKNIEIIYIDNAVTNRMKGSV